MIYNVISDQKIDQLIGKVNQALNEGWQLLGPPFCDPGGVESGHFQFHQGVINNDQKSPQKEPSWGGGKDR